MINSTSKIVCQPPREIHCCVPHDSNKNGQVSVLTSLQRILKNILSAGEPNAHKHDKYQPVPLGGGSYMFIRSEPESIFREGKLQ